MRVSASMESLWQYIQSLSLSERNRIWLADKLLEGTRKEEEETEYISKEAPARRKRKPSISARKKSSRGLTRG